jgi:hypothetical protein
LEHLSEKLKEILKEIELKNLSAGELSELSEQVRNLFWKKVKWGKN